MNEAAELVIDDSAEILSNRLVKQMIVQLRAMDTYGTYDTWSDAKVLDPMILTKERRREIPVVGDPDETTIARVKAYYNGIAQMIEAETGIMAVSVINLTHEGFGRVMICVGKLIALDKTLRDVHRFGFLTPEKMIEEAEKLIEKAVGLVQKYREVAEL